MSDNQYTRAVGTKFYPDGRVRSFPGISLISFISLDMSQYRLLTSFQDDLKRQAFAGNFAFLPPSSFHMTVTDLLCEQVRLAEHWSDKLPLDMPFNATQRQMMEWLSGAILPRTFNMRFDMLMDYEVTVKPFLLPADFATDDYLRDLRKTVSSITGITHPNHDLYRFHISLAYQIIEMDDLVMDTFLTFLTSWEKVFREEFGVLALAEPKLVFFPDMFSFPEKQQT